MKNTSRFLGVVAFIAALGLLPAGCASQPAASPGGMTLDQAIADAAARIDARIPAGSKIALLNFSSPSDRFSLYVLDELSANLLDSGKLTVVDRREIDLIRAEIDFQYSGEVADDSMQAVGRRLGAQSIVSGALTEIGRNMYRVAFRVLNVETAAVEVHHRANIAADSLVLALLEGGRTAPAAVAQPRPPAQSAQPPAAQSLAAQAAQAPAAQAALPQPAPAAPAAPAVTAIEVTARSAGTLFFQDREIATLWDGETYSIPVDGPGTFALRLAMADRAETRSVVVNARGITRVNLGGTFAVGDVGPAGGMIFYDRGRHIDGWRWLEAASQDLAVPAEWGTHGQNIIGTSTALGTGRQNTQVLVNHLRQRNESGRAAELAQNFIQNGFMDWFLPSREELNLMHVNLRQRGLGNFTGNTYWSSSQGATNSANSAWSQRFADGRQRDGSGLSSKTSAFLVRPIRAF